MNLTDARQALADALSTLDGVQVRPRPSKNLAKVGDGWVIVGRIEPADFTRCTASLTAVVLLGTDDALAEELMETLAVDLLDAATTMDDLPAGDVALEPTTVPASDGTPVKALTVTLTTEVDPA